MYTYLITLTLLIVFVVLIRSIFRKTVSPRILYALWLVVIIRMFLPITLIEVDFSRLNWAQVGDEIQDGLPVTSLGDGDRYSQSGQITVVSPSQTDESLGSATPSLTPTQDIPDTWETEQGEMQTSVPPAQSAEALPNENISTNRPISWRPILLAVWGVGSAMLAVWFAITGAVFHYQLYKERKLYRTIHHTKVYLTDRPGVPCLAGIIPSIYIQTETKYHSSQFLIMIHEYTHLRHGDHIWNLIRILSLILFWWNPLVWVAAYFSKQDAELACDDAIAAKLDDKKRLEYAHIILDTVPQEHRYAVGLGSGPIKERIFMLKKKHNSNYICVILAILLAITATGCAFMGKPSLSMENIFAQSGFTISSQQNVTVPITLESEFLPSYGFLFESDEGKWHLDDPMVVYAKGASTIVLNTIDVDEDFAESEKDKRVTLGFSIQHALTEKDTVLTITRIHNAKGAVEYVSALAVLSGTIQDDNAVYYDAIDIRSVESGDVFYLYLDADVYKQLAGKAAFQISLNQITYERGSAKNIYANNDTLQTGILKGKASTVDSLPGKPEEALFSASPVGGNPRFYVFETGLTYYVQDATRETSTECTMVLPEGYTNGKIIQMTSGAGSGEIFITVETQYEKNITYLSYYFYAGESVITPMEVSVLSDDEIDNLQNQIAEHYPIHTIFGNTDRPFYTLLIPTATENPEYVVQPMDDRHSIYLTYQREGEIGHDMWLHIVDGAKGKIVYEFYLGTTYIPRDISYTDDGCILFDAELVDDTYTVYCAYQVAYKDGKFSVNSVKHDAYPRRNQYMYTPDGTVAAYQTIENGSGFSGIDIRYGDGTTKRIITSTIGTNDLSKVRGYIPIGFVDDAHLIYQISGWEWIVGYGIYNIYTHEKTEIMENVTVKGVRDGYIYLEKSHRMAVDETTEGLEIEIWYRDLSGQMTCIASTTGSADGIHFLPDNEFLQFKNDIWVSFETGNYGGYSIGASTDNTICVKFFTLDFSQKMLEIEIPYDLDFTDNIIITENGITAVAVVKIEEKTEAQKTSVERLASEYAQKRIPHIQLQQYRWSNNENTATITEARVDKLSYAADYMEYTVYNYADSFRPASGEELYLWEPSEDGWYTNKKQRYLVFTKESEPALVGEFISDYTPAEHNEKFYAALGEWIEKYTSMTAGEKEVYAIFSTIFPDHAVQYGYRTEEGDMFCYLYRGGLPHGTYEVLFYKLDTNGVWTDIHSIEGNRALLTQQNNVYRVTAILHSFRPEGELLHCKAVWSPVTTEDVSWQKTYVLDMNTCKLSVVDEQ